MARALNAAYGEGLLSESTLVHRLDLLFGSRLIEPSRLVGDLTVRSPKRALAGTVARAAESARRRWRGSGSAGSNPAALLALDWAGEHEDLILGRHPDCDIVLTHSTVSRRHARLSFRDGHWIVRDLDSTNGTTVNDTRVVRCQLLPGDRLVIGDEHLIVD